MPERREFDQDAYLALVRERPCFICGLVSGDPDFAHPLVYEDEFAVVFLNKYPTLLGYLLVCPKAHREQVTGDFELDDIFGSRRSFSPLRRRFARCCGSSASTSSRLVVSRRTLTCIGTSRPCRQASLSNISSSTRWTPNGPVFSSSTPQKPES